MDVCGFEVAHPACCGYHIRRLCLAVGRFEEQSIPRVSKKKVSWDSLSKNNI